MNRPEHVLPADIERTSMAIIEQELREMGVALPEETAAVVRRVIHTTADFSYADNLRFTEHAAVLGAEYLSRGGVIVTDTNMSLAGISRPTMEKLGVTACCLTSDPEAAARARAEGTTRAAAGTALAAERWPGAAFFFGNAPTALMTLADKIREGLRPALVVGVPVGFVNVCESKAEILEVCEEHQIPAIVALGRKGGSNVAAAIANALLYTAAGTLDPAARGWQ